MKTTINFFSIITLLIFGTINLNAQDYTLIPGGDSLYTDTLLKCNSNYFVIDDDESLLPGLVTDDDIVSSEVILYEVSGQDSVVITDIKGIWAGDSIIHTVINGNIIVSFIGAKIILQVPADIPPDIELLSNVSLILKVEYVTLVGSLATHTYYRPNLTFHFEADDNIMWGNETMEGDFNGGMNGWTTNAISDPDAAWVWEADGKADLGAFSAGTGDEGIQSLSNENGAMVFDSDFYDNNGDQGDMGGGIAPAPQLSELISPVIDISDATEGVAVVFNQYVRQFTSIFAISYSMDGGGSWSDLIYLNEDLPANEQTDRFDVQRVPLPGATGSSEFQIKFTISGNYYFWIIDDVKLLLHDFIPGEFVVWGTEPNQGAFDGGLNGWTSNPISDPDAEWVWEADGKADLGAYSGGSGDIGIFSPTVFNGAAVFDSDFYDNDGEEGNFGNGIAPAPQLSELISPAIDLSGNPYQLWLKFHQYFRQFNSNTSIAYSMDNGNSWSDPIVINEAVPQNEQTARTDIQYVLLDGAIGTDQFRVKFIMDGNYYFWIVDDVKILADTSISLLPAVPVLVSPNDGAMNEPVSTSLTWEPIDDADSYIVQLDTTMDFSSPFLLEETAADNSLSIPYLDYDQSYFWRIKATNLAGESGWSEVWSFTTEMPNSLDETDSQTAVYIFPNPTDGSFTIGATGFDGKPVLKIVNSLGQQIWQSAWNFQIEKEKKIDLSNLPDGVYWAVVQLNEKTMAKKFVLQK